MSTASTRRPLWAISGAMASKSAELRVRPWMAMTGSFAVPDAAA